MRSSPIKTRISLLAAAMLIFSLTGTAHADKPKSPIKKTLDGRCLTPDHPDYWDTNIYIAKPSVESCVASGGQLVAAN